MPRVLLTGAGGFVGHHCLEHVLTTTDWHVHATDSFRHKGKTDRIAQVLAGNPQWGRRVHVATHDLAAPFSAQARRMMGPLDYIIAMASESHVDRALEDPVPFVRNNVDVILETLELAREKQPRHVIIISTDEVYGPEQVTGGEPVPHPEWAPVIPSNPYSASKAAQEAIAIAYWRSYGVPITIVNCMNLIGERQDQEKYLPTLISRIRKHETVTVHGRPGDIGTRHYLHARNLADAIVFLLQQQPAKFAAHATVDEHKAAYRAAAKGRRELVSDRPDRYNVVGPDRVDNLQLAEMVAKILGEGLDYDLVDFHSARPGHDPHYGLDPAKLTGAGWTPPVPFAESLERTVRWTTLHPEWLL